MEVRLHFGRLTRDVEPPHDLVERRLIGQECGRRKYDRTIRRGDRGDLARMRNQRRQPGLNIRGRIGDCQQHGGKVGVLQLADRRRLGRQLLNRCADIAVVRNRNRVDVRIVELIEVRRDVGGSVKNVEPAWDLVERRLIGQERRHGIDWLAIRHRHRRVRVGRARTEARRVGQSKCRRRGERVRSKNKVVEFGGDRGVGPRKEINAGRAFREPTEACAVGQCAASARDLDRKTV